MLNLYSFYHLNIMFSSIPISKREEVIQKCYWPLLNLVNKYKFALSIEATALTLEIINEIDSKWIKTLKDYIYKGYCDFIGSGYSQIIGPLISSDINQKNLLVGQDIYSKLLNFIPNIGLINEQAYSSGLIKNYLRSGYDSIIMEWENSYNFNMNWNINYKFTPQLISDIQGEEIKLIWNHSTSFQKFQRYVHSEIEFDEYLKFINKFNDNSEKYFSLYGSDAEIFNFRPGRYKSESSLNKNNEWSRIENIYEYLIKEKYSFKVIKLSQIVKDKSNFKNNNLNLQHPSQPIPVKKQNKYNILRWAVTGRNDLLINSRCERIRKKLIDDPNTTFNDWKYLCYLWSSDFRTHITEKRWHDYLINLDKFEKLKKISNKNFRKNEFKNKKNIFKDNIYSFDIDENFITIKSNTLKIIFNLKKGLVIENYIDYAISSKSIFGTIKHGYFEDINWSADFFSGHLTLEIPGERKFTDLIMVQPEISEFKDKISIKCKYKNDYYKLEKIWDLDFLTKKLKLYQNIESKNEIIGSLRCGYLTFNPEIFDNDFLKLSTNNGGFNKEVFYINDNLIDLGKPVSFLVSSSNAFGLTNERLKIEDKNIIINLKVNKCLSNTVCYFTNQRVE